MAEKKPETKPENAKPATRAVATPVAPPGHAPTIQADTKAAHPQPPAPPTQPEAVASEPNAADTQV